MMTLLRRSVSGWAGKLVLGLMLGVFAVAWTIADGFSGRISPNTVLTAGGTTVSLQDYQVAYQQSFARISQQLQRRPTPEEAAAFGVDQSALSQLAAGAVLDEQGRVLGLGLSEQGLLRMIAEDPSFHDASGNFSRNAFRAVLQNAGMSEAAYIERLGETALRTQITEAISSGLSAPQTFAAALGLYTGERRTISTISLAREPLDTIADPSEEEIEAYFAENAAAYAAPEYRSFTYVDLSAETVADPASVSDEQIAADYEANRARFTTPERRRVQQIVFSTQDAAAAAAARLDEGASFEDVAAEAGRSLADIDLGLLARTEIPDANIAEAAFSLAPDEPSAVVPGIFGPTILRVTEIEAEGVRPLEEVSDELREELALENADQFLDSAYNSFEDARASGATMAEAAEQAGLSLTAVEAVDRGGTRPDGTRAEGLPAEADLLEAVFDTLPDFDNPPLNYDSNAFLFYDVTEIEEARERTLDEVRDEVIADLKTAEADELLSDRLATLRERVEGGEAFADMAAAEGLEVTIEAGLTRATATPRLGEVAGQTAFSGPVGTVDIAPAADGESWLLLHVDETASPADPFSGVPQQQIVQIGGTLQNDLLQSYVGRLQSDYPVHYNQAAIQAAQSIR